MPRKQKVTWSDQKISYFLNLPEVVESHYYPMLCLSALLGPRLGESVLHKRLLWKKENRLEDPEWGDNNYLFVSQNGLPIKPHQYANGFKRLLTVHSKEMEYKAAHGKLPKNGQILPYITLYEFRTSFATNNMRRCPNAALISSVMGNSPKTLLQFYAQSDVEMQKELINNYIDLKSTASI